MSATPASSQEQPWARLALGMLVVQPLRELIRAIPLLIALLFAGHGSSQPPWSLVGVAVFVGVGVMRWVTTRYRISATTIEVRKGLVGRRTLTVPRDRIRTVDVSAHPLQRVLGLVKVEIGTGTSDRKAQAIALDGLPRDRAATLRAELLHRAQAASPSATPAGPSDRMAESERELVRLDPRWIRYAPATLSGAVTALFLVGLGWRITGEAHLHPDQLSAVRAAAGHLGRTPLWLDVVEVGVTAALVVAVLSIAGYVFAFWGFRLSRHSGGSLHVQRGLFTTRATSIEERRLRGVETSEPLLLRVMGGSRSIAIATGLRVGRGSERGGSLLVPPSPREVSARVQADVLASAAPGAARLVPRTSAALRRRLTRAVGAALVVIGALGLWTWRGSLPVQVLVASFLLVPIAAALGVDRFHGLGYRVVADARTGGRWLVTRYGSLVRRRVALSTDGVIGVTLRQSIFQRRSRLTSVTVTTSAGRQQYPVTDLTDGAATSLVAALVPAAKAFLGTTATANASDPSARELSRTDGSFARPRN